MLEISRQELAHAYGFSPIELEIGRYKLGELLNVLKRLHATFMHCTYQSRYYRRNREKRLAWQRKYYREHSEQCKAYQREYRKRKKILQTNNSHLNG